MKHIIQDMINRLSAEVTDLKYVGQDWGQLSFYNERPPVKFPCALIDFDGGSFSNEGRNVQEGILQFTVTLADWSQRVSRPAPNDMQNRELAIYDLMEDVYKALQGWTGGTDYSPFVRVAVGKQVSPEGYRVRTITFTVNRKDSSAKRVANTAVVTELKIEN